MTTTEVMNKDVIPQQNGDPTVEPDGTEVALGQLNIEDNDITMVNAEEGSVEAFPTPEAREKILRDLTISIPATKIPKVNKEVLPNKRPLLSKDLKFEIPDKKLELKGDKNKPYLIKMLFRGMKSALMCHHECQPETADFMEILNKARNFERAEQNQQEAEIAKIHSMMGINNGYENVHAIETGTSKHASPAKSCRYREKCYRTSCKFQHPPGWDPKQKKTPYERKKENTRSPQWKN